MFKKKATFKPATAIRNSERKILAADIRSRYSTCFLDKGAEEVQSLLDQILPSGIESTQFTTTKGQRGTLYLSQAQVIFIKFDDKLIPSLQTIWKCPDLITTVLTGSQVLANLQAGSDLMVKGMFEVSTSVKAGDIVGIRITGKSAPVAIGVAALDFDRLKREDGGKGILVCVCLGDTLTPEAQYPIEEESLEENENAEIPQSPQVIEDVTIEEEFPTMSTKEVDETFVRALLYGLYSVSSTGQQASMSLPISSSSLIDKYVLPFLPSDHPDLVLKKTTWKKATKFISKQSILTSKEKQGQMNITSIDWNHDDLRAFVPYRLPQPAKSDTEAKAIVGQDQQDRHTQKSALPFITVEDLYSVPTQLRPLFPEKHEPYMTADDLRNSLDTYFSENNLVSTSNPKMITLDPHLFQLLGKTTQHKELSRIVLHRSLVSSCTLHHRINNGKIKKGKPPLIRVSVESRQGRKQVTKLSHLENYFRDAEIDGLADELKRKCAVSVSVGEVKGTKPGSTKELMVQGDNATAARQALQARGIQGSFIG